MKNLLLACRLKCVLVSEPKALGFYMHALRRTNVVENRTKKKKIKCTGARGFMQAKKEAKQKISKNGASSRGECAREERERNNKTSHVRHSPHVRHVLLE